MGKRNPAFCCRRFFFIARHNDDFSLSLHAPLQVASAGVPTRQGGRGHHMVHVRARFCWPRAVALALTVCSTNRSPRRGHEHQVAAWVQISSPMPGRRARGEGTSKVSVRQERGYAGALPARASRPVRSFESVADRPGEAYHADQGGLRQLRAAAEVAQGVGP